VPLDSVFQATCALAAEHALLIAQTVNVTLDQVHNCKGISNEIGVMGQRKPRDFDGVLYFATPPTLLHPCEL